MTVTALFNPMSTNIDYIGREHDSFERNKYPLRTSVVLKKTYHNRKEKITND